MKRRANLLAATTFILNTLPFPVETVEKLKILILGKCLCRLTIKDGPIKDCTIGKLLHLALLQTGICKIGGRGVLQLGGLVPY